MDPPAAAPPPLSAAAASALHSCIADMSFVRWMDPSFLYSTLSRAEGLLCALHGCPGLPAYIQRATGAGGGGCPCTSVWTAGTIAYRCRTCGLSPSAAICVDCFRESDHEGHDYTMYTSDAGGCCDCGDESSWRPAGCCPRHRPPGAGAVAPPELPPGDAAIVRGIAGCALVRLQLALEACLVPNGPDEFGLERTIALRLMSWLGQLAQAPALRALLCEALLQPATPSAATQAGSLAATAGLLPEVAAVSRMLQQQREALLERLAAVLPVPGEAEGEGPAAAGARQQRPLPLPGPGPHRLSLLYWQLSTMLPLEGHLVEELATLHILLLYSVPFKTHFGRVLLCFYPHLGALGKRHAVTKALDRLTVQVFHLEETTLELAERDGLLEVLLGSLLAVLRRGVGAGGRLDGDSHVLAGRQYLRIAADLHMALSHPAVVLHLLGGPAAALFSGAFLQVFRLVQGASPLRRKLGEHVLYESTAWMNVVQLEVHMMHMLKQGALHTLMKAAEEGAVPAGAAAAALGFALDAALAAVDDAAGPQQTAEDPHAFWSTVLAGQGEVSAHIPLERIAAACLAGLLHLGQAAPDPAPYLAAAAQALGSAPGLEEGGRAAAARRWEMCGVAAARVLAWMSQIRQRLWVRNGQQLLRLEAFYSSPYWSDHGLDCDLLAVQAWQASSPSTSRALGFFAADSSGLRLLRASAAASLAEAVASLQAPAQSQEMLRCLADWLRLLVVTLKERSVWHPTYSPLQLRRALVHTLAVGARSHSEVEDELPYELAHSSHFDEVLAQVADYRPPTAAATGRYALKRDCWHEFDPFFPHYTRRDLQTALHTAQESGAWQPEWQLSGGLPALPAPMGGLQHLLHHLLRLVWTSLLLACSDAALAGGGTAGSSGAGSGAGAAAGGGAAEDCALAALSLLCLALQRKRADFAALVGGELAAEQAPAGGAAPPPLPAAWSTPASFRCKAEEHFVGSPTERPGILFLLRVLAGQEAWVDGSRREASWELKACAAAAAAQVQQLLQSVRQHTEAPGGPGQQGDSAAEAAAAAGPAGLAAGATQAEGAAAGQSDQQRRKAQAKQRQQQMLARMRAQQARAAAVLLDESGGETPPDRPASAAGSAPALQAQESGELEAAAMDVDDSEQQQVAGPAGAGPAAVPQGGGQAALPAHHPASLEQCPGMECALCHSGSETAPLGLVAQLQVTELPLLASADGPAGLAPDRPGAPGRALGAPSEDEEERGAAAEPFPAAGAGPRLSLFDRQPSMHLLCCGHVLHAACLDRYRSSWRQRIASGQFVEGFQLLQASTSAGEYLCPICRRLGNCLLPLAAGPSSPPDRAASAPGEAAPLAAGQAASAEQQLQQQQEQEKEPLALGCQEALDRLEHLLADGASWVSSPATSNAELVQRWQAAQEEAGVGGGAADALRLLPRLGAHAAGVAALCEFARLAGTKWILQQQRLLTWLQGRGPAVEPLWRIPVTPAAGAPAAAAAAGGAPPRHPSLEEALQDLLEHAAAADGQAAQALEAFVAAAGAMEVELEAQGEESEGEGSEGEEGEGEQAALRAAAGMAAAFEQLQQQAAAAADDATAVEEQAGSPTAGVGRGGGGSSAGAAATAIQQHNRRLWAARSAGGLLWSLLGGGIVQWEVAHRDPQAAPSSEVDGAHWRALQSLALLALAAGMGGQREARDVLRGLASGGPMEALPTSEVSAALLPTLLQLEQPPAGTSCRTDQDPFALLLQLLAALLTKPADVPPSGSPVCIAHAQPAAVLEALLAVLYPAAAGQALTLALGGNAAVAEASRAMAGSPALASAAEGAVATALLPWLQRAALLLALLVGQPAPPIPAGKPGSAAPAAAALLQRLRLPPLSAALQQPAAGSLPPPAAPLASVPGPPGVQLSIHAGGRLWQVAAPPLPAAAQLLQLPASFQAWYLSMGSQPCCACRQQPSEPALCLRCGALVCCGSRRCHGPAQQGMCYTHSLACGGGACAFLLLKMTRLLVIRKNRATFLASPYVDSHGEEDLRLQRGKPLSLHADRVRNLLQLWRSAALDFDSHVLHSANQRSESAAIY